MTSTDRHQSLLRQSLDLLDLAISKGMLDNSRAIAFAASSGAVDLLSILLHNLGKLSSGKVIEHQWFKRPKPEQKKAPIYEKKLDFNFPHKKEIFSLMCTIEEHRSSLAYGNPTESDVMRVTEAFRKLREIIEKELGHG